MSGAEAEPIPHRKTLDWRCVRAGWYVARMPGAMADGRILFVHITRTSDAHPRWGWDVRVGSDEHESPSRTGIVFTGLADLGWAKLEAEGRYGEYRPVFSSVSSNNQEQRS